MEVSQIWTTQTGYSFKIEIEKEIRTETGAKYPDKTVMKAYITGNTEDLAETVAAIEKAKKELLKQLTIEEAQVDE